MIPNLPGSWCPQRFFFQPLVKSKMEWSSPMRWNPSWWYPNLVRFGATILDCVDFVRYKMVAPRGTNRRGRQGHSMMPLWVCCDVPRHHIKQYQGIGHRYCMMGCKHQNHWVQRTGIPFITSQSYKCLLGSKSQWYKTAGLVSLHYTMFGKYYWKASCRPGTVVAFFLHEVPQNSVPSPMCLPPFHTYEVQWYRTCLSYTLDQTGLKSNHMTGSSCSGLGTRNNLD